MVNIFCKKLFFLFPRKIVTETVVKETFFAAPEQLTIPLNKLHTLKTGSQDTIWSVGTLLEILESLGKVKTLNMIKVYQELKSPTEDECVSEIFQAALEIIDKKFPKNSTELEIKVKSTEDEPELVITKEKFQKKPKKS